MQISRTAALVLALAVTAPVVAIAADAPNATDARDHKHDKRKARFARMSPEQRAALHARVQDKLATYVVVELTSKAGLDEKKSVQLSSAVKAHLERMHASRTEKREAVENLRNLIDSKANDAALNAQIAVVSAAGNREDQHEQLLTDLSRFLTATERAKIVVALPEVMRDAMKLVREARHGDD